MKPLPSRTPVETPPLEVSRADVAAGLSHFRTVHAESHRAVLRHELRARLLDHVCG